MEFNWLTYYTIHLLMLYIVSLIGFNLYLKKHNRFLLLTQPWIILFIISTYFNLWPLIRGELYDVIIGEVFVANYIFLFFAYEYALLDVIIPNIKYKKWFVRLAELCIFLVFELIYYFRFKEMNESVLSFTVIFVSSYLIALISFIKVRRHKIRREFLVLFQSSFAGCLIIPFKLHGEPFSFSNPVGFYGQYDLYLAFALTGIGILYFGIYKILLKFWKRNLIDNYPINNNQLPISIYPDPAYYVDTQGRAKILEKYIDTSNGGVIGITGVRGAGKTALLQKVISELKGKYYTLHITSPVHSSDRMEFFMMVCQEVCTKVIDDIEEKIFHFKETSISKGLKALISFIRLFIIFIAIIMCIWEINSHYQNKAMQNQHIANDKYYDNLHEDIFGLASINQLRRMDSTCIESLIKGIDNILNDSTSTFGTVVIVPNINSSPMTVMSVPSDLFNLHNYHHSFIEQLHNNVFPIYNDKWFANEMKDYIKSMSSIYDVKRLNYLYYVQIILNNNINLNEYYRDDDHYNESHDYIANGVGTFRLYSIISCSNDNIMNHINSPLIITMTDAMGKLFGISNSVTYTNIYNNKHINECFYKNMSYMFLETYYRNAVSDKNGDYVLDRRRAAQLKIIMNEYMKDLYGTTLVGYRQKEEISFIQSIMFGLNNIEFIILSLVIIMLSAGPYVLRKFNAIMAVLMNYKAFGLLQSSREFLKLLSFSESKENTGEISLPKGFRFITSRTLTERNLTLPALTNRFKTYIEEICDIYKSKTIIAIDELDKIDDPIVVKHILQELKGGLFIKNSFYLISISEDAARSFESRLSSGRDIFESTFDEFIAIRRLNSEQARSLIQRRLSAGMEAGKSVISDGSLSDGNNEGYLISNADVLALLSGGIPRELIRYMREVKIKYDNQSPPSSVTICKYLFKNKIIEFQQSLSEVQISGDGSFHLYDNLKKILNLLSESDQINIGNIHGIMVILEECISIIDPEGLYNKVTESSEKILLLRYKSVKKNVQTLIELLTSARVLLFYSNKECYKKGNVELFEKRIFSVYDALSSNPALAKYILNEKESEGNVLEYIDD